MAARMSITSKVLTAISFLQISNAFTVLLSSNDDLVCNFWTLTLEPLPTVLHLLLDRDIGPSLLLGINKA